MKWHKAPLPAASRYTVAQLTALGAGGPTVAYCTDCLAPEGVGAPVVWDGSKWVSTCSGITATTDLITFFRGARQAGRTYYSPAGKLSRYSRAPVELNTNQFVSSGTGARVGALGDGEGNEAATGSTATGWSRVQDYTDTIVVGTPNPALGGLPVAAAYVGATVYHSAVSSATDEYHSKLGFTAVGGSHNLATDEVALVYDRANSLGLGGTPTTFKALTRKASVNTVTPLAATPAVTAGTAQTLEVLLTPTYARFYIDGAQVAEHTTNLPVSDFAIIRPNLGITKTAGTNSSAIRFFRFVGATRY